MSSARRSQRLNPDQHDAVHHDGNLLITACPGSGKTFVLRERAIRLLKADPDASGVAVTFTRDAAQELERRIMTAYPEAGGRITCGTFHSLCKMQLEGAGIPVNLISNAKQYDFVQRAIRSIAGPGGVRFEDAQSFIDRMKCSLHPDVPLSGPEETLGQIYLAYQELLLQIGAMDFADLLVVATRLMATGKVPPMRATFMLVDEAQDSDNVQTNWVKAHVNSGVEVCLVGDDDQSIFGFRFAGGVDSLLSFKDFARASHISLNTTYRCAHEIVAPAAALIEHSRKRMPKKLRTENLDPGTVRVMHFPDQDAEIQEMIRFMARTGAPNSWGILCRTNKLATRIETAAGAALATGRFPVSRNNSKSFWDMPLPAALLALSRSICFDTMDGIDTVLALANVDEGAIRRIHERFPPRRPGVLSTYLREAASGAFGKVQAHFAGLAAQWRSMLLGGHGAMSVDAMASYLLATPSVRPEPGAKRGDERYKKACALVESSARSIKNARANGIDTACVSYDAFCSRLRLLSQEQNNAGDQVDDNAARLLTMHASKGLEFPNVWIAGADVSRSEVDERLVDEERRLFYVAMTRAKQNLLISYSDTPSRFLYESGLL